jgi:hypothetical protein
MKTIKIKLNLKEKDNFDVVLSEIDGLLQKNYDFEGKIKVINMGKS